MVMTVRDFVDRWPELYPRRSPETTRHNAQMVRPFAQTYGRLRLDTLERRHAVEFARRHPSHARYARTLLSDAHRDGLIERNPFDGVALARSRGRADNEPLSEAQVFALIGASPGWLAPMVAVCAFTGLRLSQAAGLEVPDIDMRPDPWRARVGAQKGAKAREVAIAPRVAREALLEAVGDRWGGFVFRSATGRPLTRSTVCRGFKRARDLVALPDVDFHELRHFAASWMVDRGMQPIDLAMQLHGSTNPSTVLEFYVKVSRERSFARLGEVCS
jgi:integrase